MNKYEVLLTVGDNKFVINVKAEDHDAVVLKAVKMFYKKYPCYKDLATVYGVELYK